MIINTNISEIFGPIKRVKSKNKPIHWLLCDFLAFTYALGFGTVAESPPSTVKHWPVTNLAASDASHAVKLAISSGWAIAFNGDIFFEISSACGFEVIGLAKSVSVSPGAIQLKRIFRFE